MSPGSIVRAGFRMVSSVPGYARLRRAGVRRARRSPRARRLAQEIYPQLQDRSIAKEQISRQRALTRAAQAELKAAQQAHRAELEALRAEHGSQIRALQAEQEAAIKALRAEHRDKVRETKARSAAREERQRRDKPAVSAGQLVTGFYLGTRPLIVIDARGVGPGTARQVLEEIVREQVLGCGFRPLFISDLPDASVWRRYGHLCEEVPLEEGWSGVTDFADYLAARLESIRADYDASWVLTLSASGVTEVQRAFLRRCGR